MPITFKIPRLVDRDLFETCERIAQEFAEWRRINLLVFTPVFGKLRPNVADGPDKARFATILAANSQMLTRISLSDSQSGAEILTVDRTLTEPFDNANVHDQWLANIPEDQKSHGFDIYCEVFSLAREGFKSADLDATLSGLGDSDWSKFRNNQVQILSSLQNALQQLIVQASEENARIERERMARFSQLEDDLKKEIAGERERLLAEHQTLAQALELKKATHAAKEKEFETREARYVARQKQQEQIEQLKGWLENWSLTKGTTEKRTPIVLLYSTAMLASAALTIWATKHNYDLLSSAEDLAKLHWWHWLALTAKSFFPFAAFATFTIYFIRWTSAWAKQHAEEEFRNRTRLVDIGRSGWLLEAVRDAQEKGGQIPSELLRELSRNLFAHSSNSDADIHPAALSDLMMQGLSSIRVKSQDGSEIEASRDRGKK